LLLYLPERAAGEGHSRTVLTLAYIWLLFLFGVLLFFSCRSERRKRFGGGGRLLKQVCMPGGGCGAAGGGMALAGFSADDGGWRLLVNGETP